MQTVYLHTQFGPIKPVFFIGKSGKDIIINDNIIKLNFILSRLIVEYYNDLEEFDLNDKSFTIDIYEGICPRVIIFIDDREFRGIISLQEVNAGHNIFA